jgi:hypothetical protein
LCKTKFLAKFWRESLSEEEPMRVMTANDAECHQTLMTEIAQSNCTVDPGEYVTLWLKHVAL